MNLVQAVSHGVNTQKVERILPLGIGIRSAFPSKRLQNEARSCIYSSNLPVFGPGSSCTEVSLAIGRIYMILSETVQPPFVLTRMTGGALAPSVSLNPTTGFPEENDMYGNRYYWYRSSSDSFPCYRPSNGINTCLNGICQLPGTIYLLGQEPQYEC